MKNVALIPLRGGSKGIPHKNIKRIAGKPLCAWTIEAAINAKSIDKVYVSTDSIEIKKVVKKLGLGVIVINRPSELATDEASTELVMEHFKDNISFENLVTIQATSPLVSSNDLDAGLKYFNDKNFDSLLSVVRSKRFYWSEDGKPLNYDPKNRPLRQEFEGIMMENGAFYITSRYILEALRCRVGGNIGVFEMAEESSTEIDELNDWQIVEYLLKKRFKK